MKKILFLCATHWDEWMFIESFKHLDQNFKNYYDVVVVNKLAYKKNIRYIKYDMNRNAPWDIMTNHSIHK